VRKGGGWNWFIGCIQTFPDWPTGAKTADGRALCHYVQLYRYFVSQSSEFCRHNPLCCSSESDVKGKRILRLSTQSGNFWIHYRIYVKLQVEVFRVVTPRSVVVGYQCFGGPFCLHLQVITRRHNPEELDLNLHHRENLTYIRIAGKNSHVSNIGSKCECPVLRYGRLLPDGIAW
jgi:hypothetical protein